MIAEPAQRSLFSITFAAEDGTLRTIDGAAAGQSDVNIARTDSGAKAVIQYREFSSADVEVEVTAQ